ncbi:hypothetical protein PMAC_002886 [Pneumocystis sp. 'macacae']|nr:hypothetical protein PMAC_002886 [Pneumocystis sp. 'macacae']
MILAIIATSVCNQRFSVDDSNEQKVDWVEKIFKKGIFMFNAMAIGCFIGASFVVKKKGLLDTTRNKGLVAGKGHAYLKNGIWWTGMLMLAIGELFNFVAYAFASAILVTPLEEIDIFSAIGSSVFLKERLSFVGKVGCAFCMIGVCVIVINAPEQQLAQTVQEIMEYIISRLFLIYILVVFFISAVIALWVGPRWGNKSIFVYISIPSLIGGITVGFGISVTAIVTPVYFTYFTTCTIISTAILYKGFNGTPIAVATVFLGFLTIVGGVLLLQFSIGADNTSDTDMLSADLSNVQKAADAETDADVLDPGPAAIRGTFTFKQMERKFSQSSSNNFIKRISYSSVDFQKFSSTSRTFMSEGSVELGKIKKNCLEKTVNSLEKITNSESSNNEKALSFSRKNAVASL